MILTSLKIFIGKIKIYLIGAAIVAGVLLVWSARGWYEDSKTKDALVTVIKEGNEQTTIDRAITRSSLEEQDNVDAKFNEIPSHVSDGDTRIVSIIVRWNKANTIANQAGIP